MSVIAPTITAENAHQYREQMERVQGFAKRIHVDLMDGIFTPNTGVDIAQVWLPDDIICDIHLMYQKPQEAIETLIKLNPHAVVVPAESDCDFMEFSQTLHQAGIKCGVALLAKTPVEQVEEVIKMADQVLIFSGNLGYQGGSVADLSLLSKIEEIKKINPTAEIAWDGGVNDQNVQQIAQAGVDVINTGGFIHHHPDPKSQYQLLEQTIS